MTRKQSEPEVYGEISIIVNLRPELIEIVFKDNGCGMSSMTQKKIFDPFYTTKEVGDGTGLGMAISFGIIEDHSGTLKVSSVVNKGSIITICLPVK
jgi:signal transduction histidine kinase